jgi:hypothetical protein
MRASCTPHLNVRRIAALGLAACAAAAIAGCGGSAHRAADGARATPGVLLAKTFRATGAVRSGNVDLHVALSLDGGIGALAGKPITLDVSGPFSRSGESLSADLAISLDAGPLSRSAEIVAAGGAYYVKYGGTWYQLPHLPHDAGGATGTTGASGAAGILSSLGIDPRSWLTSPHDAGAATVGGVDTERFTAGVDVQKMLADLGRAAAQRLATLPGGATGAIGSKLTSGLTTLGSAVHAARLDVYTGLADRIVRRVHVGLAFTVPSALRAHAGGLQGGTLDLTATLTDLGAPESITAPAGAKPFPAGLAFPGRHAVGSMLLPA